MFMKGVLANAAIVTCPLASASYPPLLSWQTCRNSALLLESALFELKEQCSRVLGSLVKSCVVFKFNKAI